MADTISPAKKYYDQANQAIDEQAILDKYNAATAAQFNVQREQNRQAENKFYNQMYNTQKTAMDTIRQSNAAAVSSGASRGVQAANELSALLGLQQESVASATELAQTNRQTAQEETAAVLENVLKAYQQAQQERAQMVQHGIEAASVETETAAANATATRANNDALQAAAETGTANYLSELSNQGKVYTDYSSEGAASLNIATSSLIPTIGGANATGIFNDQDWDSEYTGAGKAQQTATQLYQIINFYGLNPKDYEADINSLVDYASKSYENDSGRSAAADKSNIMVNNIITKIKAGYANKYVG
jgi:hypothetical protein